MSGHLSHQESPNAGRITLKRIGPAGGRAKIFRSKAANSTQKPEEKSTGVLGQFL
jgi:hypothetical protein